MSINILTLTMPLLLHVHGDLYEEKGLINSREKDIKYGKEILELLDAIWAPKRVAVMYCRGHQKGDTVTARGSRKADRKAKLVASKRVTEPTTLTDALFPTPLAEWDPKYSQHEDAWFKTENGSYLSSGWWKFEDGRIAIPEALAPAFVRQFHQKTHMGRTAIQTTLGQYFYIPWPSSISRVVCE